MPFRLLVVTVVALVPAACSGGVGGSTEPSATAAPAPSATVSLPAGVPSSYPDAVNAADLPPASLVPVGSTPSELWPVAAPEGTQYAVVAYTEPSGDPFRQVHGVVVWRRSAGEPPWQPVFAASDPPDAGVVEIRATIGDVTGDGSPDALTFADTGGSGACGIWRVLDLAGNTQAFRRHTCDTTIDISADPIGLVIREAVFAPGDAHCCPSAWKISTLTYEPASGWTVESIIEQPT